MLAIRKKLQLLLGAILMLLLALACVVSPATAQAPDTTADAVYGQGGSFTTNTDNAAGVSANSLFAPAGVALDGDGNLYVSDPGNNRVLFYVAGSTTATRVYGQAGSFTTGSANAGGLSANNLFAPFGVALDGAGNLYVADAGNNRVLFYAAGSTTATRVYGQGGSFTTRTENAGGLSANSLEFPTGLALDGAGNLYVADAGNNRVLFYPAGSTTATRVYGQGGSFTTNAGGLSANSLFHPEGVVLDGDGNLYVADSDNNRVLFYAVGSTTATRVYGQGGSFTTGTGNTGGRSANSLFGPRGVALDGDGNLYVADRSNNRVLFYAAGSTTATQVYGQGGSFTTGTDNTGGLSANSLSNPRGLALDDDGNLYLADQPNNRVLLFNAAKLSQTITFGALAGKTFGDAAFTVSATASSNLTVSFGASGNCNVAGTLVTITGAGSCTITASQAGDAAYFAAPDVPQTFAIAKATPLITWSNPADISPGTPLSSTQLNATVTLNGSNVSGTFVYTPGSGTVLPAGSNQQLALNFTPADTTNYNTPAQKVVSINVVGLTVVPNSAVRGGSVTVSWSGIPSPSATDWIGLYQVGAPNSPFWEWEYVSCSRAATVAKQAGSCSFPIPSPPNGTYELRLFSNNGFTRIFTSNPFTIGVAAPTLPVVTIAATTNATEPSSNGTFTVSRSIVSADPLTVNYTVTGSATANGDYATLSGAVTIPSNAQTAPITVSPIDDNVFEGNESVIVTLTGNPAYTLGSPSNATLQIIDNESPPAGPTLTVTQGSVVRGGSVTVTWSGIVSPSASDWFGLYQVGAPNSPFWEWEYVSCTKSATTSKVSGTCTFPIPVNPPAGNYNLRLFSNNGFTLLTTSNTFVLQ